MYNCPRFGLEFDKLEYVVLIPLHLAYTHEKTCLRKIALSEPHIGAGTDISARAETTARAHAVFASSPSWLHLFRFLAFFVGRCFSPFGSVVFQIPTIKFAGSRKTSARCVFALTALTFAEQLRCRNRGTQSLAPFYGVEGNKKYPGTKVAVVHGSAVLSPSGSSKSDF